MVLVSTLVPIVRRTGLAVLVGLAAGLMLWCTVANADFALGQTPAAGNTPSTGNTGAKPAKNTHPRSRKNKAIKAVAEPAPAEVRPAAPPPPNWPVNDKAKLASVAWNGRDLSIAATNSSLGQILHDVSTATGLKVEGLASSRGGQNDQHGDQRIYGSFGPASERDVLSQLLEGSGYNVIMVGDQGEGMPRELLLTAQASGAKGAEAANAGQPNQPSEEDVPEEPEPPPPDPQPEQHPPPPNGQPGQPPQGGRTPQQLLQEMQQRQQQIQQQQQQGNQPPNPNE